MGFKTVYEGNVDNSINIHKEIRQLYQFIKGKTYKLVCKGLTSGKLELVVHSIKII